AAGDWPPAARAQREQAPRWFQAGWWLAGPFPAAAAFPEEAADDVDPVQPAWEAANDTAWMCAFAPQAVPDPALPVRLAERAVGVGRQWEQLNTLGAVLYRAGRHEEAIQRLTESMHANPPEGTPSDWLFLAMAHPQLGHRGRA